MNAKNRSMLVGLGGFFSGLMVSLIVPFNTLPKAMLVAAIAAVVSVALLFLIPQQKQSEPIESTES